MFRRKISTTATLAALALVLVACSGTSLNTTLIAPAYHRSVATSAISNGSMAVVVHGGATASLDQATTEQIIVSRVGLPGWLKSNGLIPAQGEPQRRLVYIMNPQTIGQAKKRACGPLQDIATSRGGEQITVVGAFCDDSDRLSFTSGAIDVGEDPAASLTDLVQQMTLALLPPDNPVRRPPMLYGGGP